jgi:hypothetical protein
MRKVVQARAKFHLTSVISGCPVIIAEKHPLMIHIFLANVGGNDKIGEESDSKTKKEFTRTVESAAMVQIPAVRKGETLNGGMEPTSPTLLASEITADKSCS